MSRILVLEPDQNLCNALHAILQIAGHEVICAHNGEDGLAQVQVAQPDLILCEAKLPGGDVYELLAKLRNDVGTAKIPFILMAVYLSKADTKKALSLGANAFIIKPFTEAEILRKIETTLH